jgi:hypothetical protein
MSKLIKKIRKIKKDAQYMLYLGPSGDHVDEFLSDMETVFWVHYENKEKRAKNLIYIQDAKNAMILKNISVVFLAQESRDLLLNFQGLINKERPLILVMTDQALSKECSNFFRKISYEVVEIKKQHQFWMQIT